MLHHWNYLLAIEDDVQRLSRFVEFSPANFEVYSVEIARLLMSCTQEADVLLKQICHQYGNTSESETGYRNFIPNRFPALVASQVSLPAYGLTFEPFKSWERNETPNWWTANNKVKHERHTKFSMASLENLLNSASGLLLLNLYFYAGESKLDDLCPDTKILHPDCFIVGVAPSTIGLVRIYEVEEVSGKADLSSRGIAFTKED
jgi:hypothetical protein